jgi:BlaI family penicillinase repressor
MTIRNASRRQLTDLHHTILEFVSANGPVTADQVRQALLPTHPLKDSSVRTLLRRLEERGYVSHRFEGKLFLYQAEVHPRSVAARTVEHIIQRFCSGSVEQFLVGMVDEKVLTMDQIRRLAKKVKKRK